MKTTGLAQKTRSTKLEIRNPSRASLLSMGIIGLAWASTAAGITRYVGGGGTPTYTTIQAALNAATSGVDQIEVAPGTYYEAINFYGKAIRLYSRDGAAVTTIHGNGAKHVVRCTTSEGPGTILEGFTITGGNATGSSMDRYGGGMLNVNSRPTVFNCLFTGNAALYNGGGMYNSGSNPSVTNCTFSNNSATAGNGGGMENFSNSSPSVTGCVFSNNTARYMGGAMENFSNSHPTVTNCIFRNNSATQGGGGGAMSNYNGSSPRVTHCTFSGNSALTGDGGALCNYNSTPSVSNCILWSNSPNQIGVHDGATAAVTYSDIQGGWAGMGNLNVDPLFAGAGDLHLTAGSPCIDTGTNSPTGGLPTTDIEGNARPLDGNGDSLAVADMGAYEFPATVAQRMLTTSATAGGTVTTPGLGVFPYDPGTSAAVVATPTANYHFVDWTGTALEAGKVADPLSASTLVLMDADYTLQANFAIDMHTLTISSNDGGAVTMPGEGTSSYAYGTIVNLVATPDPHYRFANWTGPVADSGSATTTVTILGDTMVAAAFAIDQHNLAVTSDGHGSATGSGTYDWGSSVPIAAAPDAHYQFVNWTPTGSVTLGDPASPNTNATVHGDSTVTAHFALDRHTLTTSCGAGGSVTAPGEGIYSYDCGTLVNLAASPEAHYHFDGWTGPVANSGSAATTVTIAADTTVQANFAIDQHTLTATTDGNGSASGSGTYNWGSSVPITATANAHYHFDHWTAAGAVTVADATAASTNVTINGDGTVTAHFALDRHTLTTSSNDGGSVTTPGEGTNSYDHGTVVNLVATPDAHHHFVNWTGLVANSGSAATTVTITADTTVQANFALDQHTLTISATAGGMVSGPGTGTFHYGYGQQIMLEAQAQPGFAFTHWSGSYFGSVSPTYFSVTGDHQIQANFVSLLDTLYVDARGPCDPQPNDLTGSDPNEDGAPEHPFDSIQEAIDVAGAGAEIFVNEGLYRERIDLTGKSVVVRALWLSDPNLSGMPVIEGNGAGPVMTFGPDANSVLSGLCLQGGRADTGPAVRCTRARATLRNCLIVGHQVNQAGGGVIACQNGDATFVNCTISGNAGVPDAAVFAGSDGQVAVSNSILWGNAPLALTSLPALGPEGRRAAGLRVGPEPLLTMSYCDVEGSWPDTGNLDVDPLFAAPGWWDDAGTPDSSGDDFWVPGDYHVRSQTGRWEPIVESQPGAAGPQWLTDAQSSPCLDAGDPASDWSAEPPPNGGRINLGAYGGTTQASQTP